MKQGKEIYDVLVVDDSIVFRKMLEQVIQGLESFQVIGSVWNGVKVQEFLDSGKLPDLITLDVEMPEMDGIETLKLIQRYNAGLKEEDKIQILMVSSKTKVGAEVTIQALELGAFDFVAKPDFDDSDKNRHILKQELQSKLAFFEERKIPDDSPPQPKARPAISREAKAPTSRYGMIAIGISTGGPKTLSRLLPELSKGTTLPIVIAQHMPADFINSLAAHLNGKCRHRVIRAEEGLPIQENTIYLAPGDKNLVLRRDGDQAICSLNDNPVDLGYIPSVDYLFRSVANLYQRQAVALVMTGMGQDGTAGISAIKRQGGLVIAQGDQSSVVWGMPARAIESGYVDHILELDDIAPFILKQTAG